MQTDERKIAFPLAWVTTGRHLLLVGGCMHRLCRLKKALEFDWEKITAIQINGEPSWCESCLNDERVTTRNGPVTEADVEQADLVIEGTLDQELGERLFVWCEKHNVPLNAMDKPELCDLHYPAMITRGPLILSIMSGGTTPALSSRLRAWLESALGPGWTLAARLFAETRNRLPGGQARNDLLKTLASDPRLIELIVENNEAHFQKWIDEAVNRICPGD